MRLLVARMDGTSESGFALGAIQPTRDVPVVRNFDPRVPPIGIAEIEVDGQSVWAVLSLHPGVDSLVGLYPALGGTGPMVSSSWTETIFDRFDVLTVGICDQPNVDPRIPAIEVM